MPADCSICGAADYVAGPNGRMTNGQPPQCRKCGSLERHRIVREVYQAIPRVLLRDAKALQFSGDMSIAPEWFEIFEVSVFERHNHLDLTQVDRPDGSYDWVIANHVLEHVADDGLAVSEMLRITRSRGFVHLTVPNPMSMIDTDDWGYPDPERNLHYRHYGSDFIRRLDSVGQPCHSVQVVGTDPQTGMRDIVYFLSPTRASLHHIADPLLRHGLIVLHGG